MALCQMCKFSRNIFTLPASTQSIYNMFPMLFAVSANEDFSQDYIFNMHSHVIQG